MTILSEKAELEQIEHDELETLCEVKMTPYAVFGKMRYPIDHIHLTEEDVILDSRMRKMDVRWMLDEYNVDVCELSNEIGMRYVYGEYPSRVYTSKEDPDTLYAVYSYFVRQYHYSKQFKTVFNESHLNELISGCEGVKLLAAYKAYMSSHHLPTFSCSRHIQDDIYHNPSLKPYMRMRLFLRNPLMYSDFQRGGEMTEDMIQYMSVQYHNTVHEYKVARVGMEYGYYETRPDELEGVMRCLLRDSQKNEGIFQETAKKELGTIVKETPIHLRAEICLKTKSSSLQGILERSLKTEYFGQEVKV